MWKEHKMTLNVLICAIYLAFTVIGVAFVKSGHGKEAILEIRSIGFSLSLYTLVGILFYGLSFLLFIFFVSKLKIAIVVPVISGISNVCIVILGYMFFKERISMGQFAGIALIIIGTVLVGLLG